MGVNGKQKGNSFERDIAKQLSLAISSNKDPNIFIRRPNSGGLLRDKSGQSEKGGDISYDKLEGKAFCDTFTVECKFYKDLKDDWLNFYTSTKKGMIYKFLEQSKEAADTNKNNLVCIIKYNRGPTLVIVETKIIMKGLPSKKFDIPYSDVGGVYEERYSVVKLETFLDIVRYLI